MQHCRSHNPAQRHNSANNAKMCSPTQLLSALIIFCHLHNPYALRAERHVKRSSTLRPQAQCSQLQRRPVPQLQAPHIA